MSDETMRIPVACKHCGAAMGAMVMVDDTIYLDTGNFLASSGRRYCHGCGRPFHFQRPKVSWRVLVQQYQQRLTAAVGSAE
jgi:hypothetical protein